jgi:hypothetical protein
MNRPTFEVADILRAKGDSFIDRTQNRIRYQQLKVMRAITRCRTAALGGHIDRCTRCGHQAISFNSCHDRHCPKCQAQARNAGLNSVNGNFSQPVTSTSSLRFQAN